MKVKPGTTECPRCGGASGFTTRIEFKATRVYDWVGRDVDTDNYIVSGETNPRCADCGVSVRSVICCGEVKP